MNLDIPARLAALLRLFSIFALSFAAPVSAGETGSSWTYQGEVAGVMCSVCSGHVKTALEKLPGVTSVKITAGKAGSLPKLTVVSTSPGLTKEDATKALGEHAKSYTIVSFSLVTRRQNCEKPAPRTPNRIEEVTDDCCSASQTFNTGHRVTPVGLIAKSHPFAPGNHSVCWSPWRPK